MLELRETISTLAEVHDAAFSLVHGVRGPRGNDPWRPFAASRFVYAFFAFNSTYSQCAWKQTINSQRLVPQEPNADGGHPAQWTQIEAVLSQMCKGHTSRILLNQYQKYLYLELARSHVAWFAGSSEGLDSDSVVFIPEGGGPLRTNAVVEDIVPDGAGCRQNVTAKVKSDFQQAWHRLLASDTSSLASDMMALHKLVYLVRCNVFHGNKRITDAVKDEAQQQRFLIYASILLATNRVFLENISERVGVTLRFEADQTVVEVPSGDLFYPCCGRDIGLPRKLLGHVCNNLHFADLNIRTPRHERTSGVIRHKSDAVQVLDRLPEDLSVFFYRRDSTDGGSGIMWLQDDLFPRVLGRLKNHGLVITDGCNGYRGKNGDCTQAPLWRDNFPKEEVYECSLPNSFEYRGRQFECLGRLIPPGNERGYGPSYIWRVQYM